MGYEIIALLLTGAKGLKLMVEIKPVSEILSRLKNRSPYSEYLQEPKLKFKRYMSNRQIEF